MSRYPEESLGRRYPLLSNGKVARPERSSQDMDDRRSSMERLTIQLPPPSGFQARLDPARHQGTEPRMYDSRCRSLRSMDFPKAVNQEQLPSVSQLLTPSSQPSLPSSPFSPHYRLDSPTSLQPSSRPSWPLDMRERLPSLAYSDGIATPPMAPPHRKLSYPIPVLNTALPLRPTSYPYGDSGKHEPDDSAYSPYVQRSNSDPSPYQQLLSAQASHYEQPLSYQMREPHQQSNIGSNRDSSQQEGSNVAQFVPRAVREEVFPGEGLCYVYEDGSHCRKVIDGDAINVNWRLTKAGKPRKRLAVACLTCREKKIKCDPVWPKCLQCDKFGRDCKFQNA